VTRKPRRSTLRRLVVDELARSGGTSLQLIALVDDLVSAIEDIGLACSSSPSEALHELERSYAVPTRQSRGEFLMLFDPLDRPSNIDVNAPVGSIFSVLRAPAGEALQHLCAGYVLYGTSTMVVMTLGRGVHGFTLDTPSGAFVLTHPALCIPEDSRMLAIDASDQRFWQPPIKRYVAECAEGESGPRAAEFAMHWSASPVAEVHRILIRGGVLLCARLPLVYEASPLSFVVENAGGSASTGTERIVEIVPRTLHERVPVVLGSHAEVERIVLYHQQHARGIDEPFRSPLFGTRSFFVQP
jgi:fructose-1,6-bisphosphatase